MAPGDECNLIEAIVTCEGNLQDPNFSERFRVLLGNLKALLREDELVKVKKIEPWNSVRVTISITKEAAQKLKQLAQQGSPVLKSLGILTVQVDGDQLISLTIAGQNNQPTELILREDGPSAASSSTPASTSATSHHLPLLQQQSPCPPPQHTPPHAPSGPHVPLGLLSPSPSSSAFIRSPNVVAPAGESIPVLPPKSTSSSTFTPHSRPSSLGLGGPFPFASMAHAAQTMQRTDHPNMSSSTTTATHSISSSSSSSVTNINLHQAVNSTNSPTVLSPATPLTAASNSSSQINQTSTTFSFPPHHQTVPSSSLQNPRAQLNNSYQHQVGGAGGLKSEQLVHRFDGGVVSNNSSPSLNPPSQSLQLQIVNAPPPYPGVNSGRGSNNVSNANNLNLNLSSLPSGGNGNINQHHLQQNANNSANLQGVNVERSSGAPFSSPSVVSSSSFSNSSSGSSSNMTLMRSISSPTMTSSSSATHKQHTNMIITESSSSLLGSSSSHQQPMSSPLLVNLLQNNEALGGGSSSSTNQGQGLMNIMLPPGSSLEHKKLILAQHLQARKAKRGLSLESASLGEVGGQINIGGNVIMAGGSSSELLGSPHNSTDVATGTLGDRASPTLLHQSQNIVGMENSSSKSLTDIMLPSSIPSSSESSTPSQAFPTRMTSVPSISVGHPRPSSDLSTTATILHGRTIIHQGHVRVFNPGQIRAIRLPHTNTTTSNSSSTTTPPPNNPNSPSPFILGKSLATTTQPVYGGGGAGESLVEDHAVLLNGPKSNKSFHHFQSPAHPSPQSSFTATTTSSSSMPSAMSAEGVVKLEPNVNNYSADQSSRTSMDNMNINAATTLSSTVTSSSSINSNFVSHSTSLRNMFIPPSSSIDSTTNTTSSYTTNHMRLSPPKPTIQERQPAQSAVQVQSQEAKLFPSQHHHQNLPYNVLKGMNPSNLLLPPPTLTTTTATSAGGKRRQLINPLTGHLEPMPSESSSESDEDGNNSNKRKVKGSRGKTGRIRGGGIIPTGPGAIQHRQIVTTTTTGVTVARVLKSMGGNDSQKFVSEDRNHFPHQNCLTVVPVTISSPSTATATSNMQIMSRKSSRDEGVVDMGLATITSSSKDKDSSLATSFAATTTTSTHHHHQQQLAGKEAKQLEPPGEKIKLRLKLEKNEPISPAYKVDVSFLKKSEKGSATTNAIPTGLPTSSSGASTTSAISTGSVISNPSYSSPSTVSLPTDQPRVPPLHISLRGKNAAVVVSSPRRDDDSSFSTSSSQLSFMVDGVNKPGARILGKGGKLRKSRVKSSEIESDPENFRRLKNPSKLSHQRLSKDSSFIMPANTPTNPNEWDIISNHSSNNSLKSRLEPPSSPVAGKSFPSTLTSSNVNIKDLVLSESKTSTSRDMMATFSSSSIPNPTVKLKSISGRRASDSEVKVDHQQHNVPSMGVRSLVESKLPLPSTIQKVSSPPPLLDSSSLLFQHLSKKEDITSPSSSVPISPGPAAVSPLGVPNSSMATPSVSSSNNNVVTHVQVSTTATSCITASSSTSVLTLTSTATGATISTAKGISATDVVRITTVSTPTSSTSTTVSEIAKPNVNVKLTGYQENVPSPAGPHITPNKLIRANLPQPLDISAAQATFSSLSPSESIKSCTPTSKSPNKPLPDLLALPISLAVPTEVVKTNNPPPNLTPLTLGSEISQMTASTTATIQQALTSSQQIPSVCLETTPSISKLIPTEKQISAGTAEEVSSRRNFSPSEILTGVSDVPIYGVKTSSSPSDSIASEEPPRVAHIASPALTSFTQQPAKSSNTNVAYSMPKPPGSPIPILRPKKQAPKVSIGTSIDSELQSLTPSPSLRELLEKEKEQNMRSILQEVVRIPKNSVDINKMVASKLSEIMPEEQRAPIFGVNLDKCVKLNHANEQLQNCAEMPDVTPETTLDEKLIVFATKSIPPPLDKVDDKLGLLQEPTCNPTEKVGASANTSSDQCFDNKAMTAEKTSIVPLIDESLPSTSTVTPNAPLPFPLILPKGESDHAGGGGGVAGEDSGIDSMDALSEKSPNQGESPARKEIEPFESHHSHLQYGGTSLPRISPKLEPECTLIVTSSPPTTPTEHTVQPSSQQHENPATATCPILTPQQDKKDVEILETTETINVPCVKSNSPVRVETEISVVCESHDDSTVIAIPTCTLPAAVDNSNSINQEEVKGEADDGSDSNLKAQKSPVFADDESPAIKAEELGEAKGSKVETPSSHCDQVDLPILDSLPPNETSPGEESRLLLLNEKPPGADILKVTQMNTSNSISSEPTCDHVDAIQELSALQAPKPQVIIQNAKFRRAKLENIVAAIGTKNIERVAKVSPIETKAGTSVENINTYTESSPVEEKLGSALEAISIPNIKLIQVEKVVTNSFDEPRVALTSEIPMQTELDEIHTALNPITLATPVPETASNLNILPTGATLEEEIKVGKISGNLSPVPILNHKIIRQSNVPPAKTADPPSEKKDIFLSKEILTTTKSSLPQGLETDEQFVKNQAFKTPDPQTIATSEEAVPTNLITTSQLPTPAPKLDLETVTSSSDPPPTVVHSRAKSPQQPILEPQTLITKPKGRPKINRRGQDKPPKLSKATETDPRPETANPPRLEIGVAMNVSSNSSTKPTSNIGEQLPLRMTEMVSSGAPLISPQVGHPTSTSSSSSQTIKLCQVVPSTTPQLGQPSTVQAKTPPPVQQLKPISVSLAATASTSLPPQQRSLPNMIQLSKAIPISSNSNLSQAISSMGSITLPLQSNATALTAGTFTIHPNMSLPANLTHLHHGQSSSITVLPGGQKMIPVKLVTIPRQSSNQFQTIPLSGMPHNRSSPNILEAVNIVTNAGSRSNSPKTQMGNSPSQGGPVINLNSVSLPGGGNIQLVPISIASSVGGGGGGSSNPVKVLVSQPVKLNQSLPHSHQQQQMIVKSVMMGQDGAPTTIQVVRPGDGGMMQNIAVVATKSEPPTVPQQTILKKQICPTVTATSTTQFRPVDPVPLKFVSYNQLTSVGNIDQHQNVAADTKSQKAETSPPQADIPSSPSLTTVASQKSSVQKRVDDLEVLDSELNQINDDDLPLEADIIHDLKDLEDVLAGESIEGQENGINSPYDFTIEEKLPEKYHGGLRKQHEKDSQSLTNKKESKDANLDTNSSPDSPIPVIRSSSPLYTYGNRSSKTSRSPSPTDESSDILHGEDQEIIDSFNRSRSRSRSPSQPKLSPQNKPNAAEDQHKKSPMKPDLTAFEDTTLSQLLSIEIPPVDLISDNQLQNPPTDERKPARSTRSNTRLVSPDITAFKSDTPKPTKFSSKPDPLILRSSPRPSPTGSLKMLSPTISSGLTLTPSSSNRSSPISLGGGGTPSTTSTTTNSNHVNSVTAAALEKISVHLSNSGTGGRGGATHKVFNSKRKRQESDSSSASKDENNEEKSEIDLNTRPGKRRCSENAAELIKACIGIEDTPKRNSMLIKRMEESNKLKEAKLKKAMATLVEEAEDDNESIESVLSRGRSRSSRASSEDRSSSRGSSVQRNMGSSKASSKEDTELGISEHKTSKSNSRPGSKDNSKEITNQSQNLTTSKKKDITKQTSSNSASAAKRAINISTPAKEKSPLTPAKTRTNVRKGSTSAKSPNIIHGAGQPPPETENLRRKTRSTAASKRYGESSDAELAALKRRRISKDTKS